jgi:DnaK suppressor protein
MADMDDVVGHLEHKRVRLEAELARMSAPPTESSGISFGKRVGEGTSMAVDRFEQVAAHDELRAVLVDVERALAKVDEGSYGCCDRCNSTIPEERLEIRPWAVLCVECAARR